MRELTRLIITLSILFTVLGMLIYIFIRPLFQFYLGAVAMIFLFGIVFLIIAVHNHSVMGHMVDSFKSQMAVHQSVHSAMGQMMSGNARVQAELIKLASNATKMHALPAGNGHPDDPWAPPSLAPTIVDDKEIKTDNLLEFESWTN